MQTEINQAGYSGKIALFSINNKNKSTHNSAGYCEGKTIPYLQDTNAENVYGSWNASKDEIVLLDKQGNFAKS